MIAHGLPIYVALEPVDMRMGSERLGALVRERMRAEPRSRALLFMPAGVEEYYSSASRRYRPPCSGQRFFVPPFR